MDGFRTIRACAVCSLLCVVLGGCVVTDFIKKLESGAYSGQEPAAPAKEEPVASAPAVEDFGSISKQATAPRPKPKPIGFSVNPQKVVNLDEADVRELMGTPAMVREEPPAVIWSYLSGECRLDVYLYENLSTKVLRSLTYVVESSRKDVAPEEYCLQQVN